MEFISEAGVHVVPCGEEHFSRAVGAYLRYGRGRHRAALNFGDCISYAMADFLHEPLLYVGGDFVYTDIMKA